MSTARTHVPTRGRPITIYAHRMRMAIGVGLLCAIAGVAAASPSTDDFVLPSGEVIPGAPLADVRALGAQVERVRTAAREALGVDIGAVPVSLVTIDELDALHRELGGQLPHGFTLFGFELRGHVFVRRALAGVPDDVVIHECLHALSERFSSQMHVQGVGKVIEGITQYFTLEALAARPADSRRRAVKNNTYVAYTDFADTLATLVGEDRLREAYFNGGYGALAQRVDTATRARHTLLRAARALEDRNESAARRILTTGR